MRHVHYYSNYIDSHDIDCFFRVGNIAFHFASNGNPIPWFITREKNIAIQSKVFESLPHFDGHVRINTSAIRDLVLKELSDEENTERVNNNFTKIIYDYAASFVEIAKRGFISMDTDEEVFFHIIASPKDYGVPNDLLTMLPEISVMDLFTLLGLFNTPIINNIDLVERDEMPVHSKR